MKKRENGRQLNNAGFSLVELMVAIIVLGIIAVPLINSFLTSARASAKSRNAMNATVLAENVMEEYEAHTITEMSATYTAAGMTVEQDADINGDGVADTGSYRITGRDATSFAAPYQLEITLDPSAYSAINSAELADIQNLSANLNAVYVEESNATNEAYGVFASNAPGYSVDQIAGYVKKEIDVKIEKDTLILDLGGGESLTTDVYRVTAGVYFECDSVILTYGAPNRYPQNSNDYIIFSNKEAVESKAAEIKAKKEAGTALTDDDVIISDLANVVVCLHPRYDGELDKVVVDNSDNAEFNLFVVEQEISAAEETRLNSLFPGMVDNKKTNYPIHVQVKEEAPGWLPAAGATIQSHCKVRTNLLDNQNTRYEFYNTSNRTTIDGIAYRPDGATEYSEGAGSVSGKTTATILQVDSLTPSDSSTRMYDIVVKIYEDGSMGTGTPLLTMTGTVTDN